MPNEAKINTEKEMSSHHTKKHSTSSNNNNHKSKKKATPIDISQASNNSKKVQSGFSIQTPGGTESSFEVHVTPGPHTSREEQDDTSMFSFANPSLSTEIKSNHSSSGSRSLQKNQQSHIIKSSCNSDGTSNSFPQHHVNEELNSTLESNRLTTTNQSSSSTTTTSQQRRRNQQHHSSSVFQRVLRLCRHLCRPFGRIHDIVGDPMEMEQHPSIRQHAPTARVTRFFLWRKWTIIVILIQMYVQVGIDLRNFAHFMRDPYQSYCPCRDVVKARESMEATSSSNLASRSHTAMISAVDMAKSMMAFVRQRNGQNVSMINIGEGGSSSSNGNFSSSFAPTLLAWDYEEDDEKREEEVGHQPSAAADSSSRVVFSSDGRMSEETSWETGLSSSSNNNKSGRYLQEEDDAAGSPTTTTTLPPCSVCELTATVARTGMLPACYMYYATPGFNQVIRPKPKSNEARVGLLGFKIINGTAPIDLVYQCHGQVQGRKTTSCFLEERMLIKKNCSLGFYAEEHVQIQMTSLLARIRYAPDVTMRWSDCSPYNHMQTRDAVCLIDGQIASKGYCEAGGLYLPRIEQECCLNSEDIYDTVFNSAYTNTLIFFDIVALFVSFSRLISMHVALKYIDRYRTSTIFIMWTWVVPFFGAFIKYSWPLNGFVSQTGRAGAIQFMSTVTGSEYVNNTALTQIMADSLEHSMIYDPIMLYLMNLVDALRSYAVYGQAFSLVSIEFYYRFLYAFMVLGELGPLAISVLPGLRSAAVVLKTLFPESATLGWMVSFAPLLYMPFLACGLAMFTQVFSDYWFTLAAIFYSLSNFCQIVFYWQNSTTYRDPEVFRRKLQVQDLIRVILLAISFAFSMVFMVKSSNRDIQDADDTMKIIGPAGFISLMVRMLFNFQLASVFTADVLLYLIRKLQAQTDRDRNNRTEYEKGIKEFMALDDEEEEEEEGGEEDHSTMSLSLQQHHHHQRSNSSSRRGRNNSSSFEHDKDHIQAMVVGGPSSNNLEEEEDGKAKATRAKQRENLPTTNTNSSTSRNHHHPRMNSSSMIASLHTVIDTSTSTLT